jgi:chloride channel, nucleotide-sensitive, 1A
MSTSGRGFQIPYPAITLHAVSRAESGPSIYCQLDDSTDAPEATSANDEGTEMRELTIIPQNAASCKYLFD